MTFVEGKEGGWKVVTFVEGEGRGLEGCDLC